MKASQLRGGGEDIEGLLPIINYYLLGLLGRCDVIEVLLRTGNRAKNRNRRKGGE